MEIEVKKDKLGGTICSLKDGERQGVSFRLEDFFKEIDYDFSDYSFEYDLASLGFRYAQLAIESDNLEENLSAYWKTQA